MKVFLSESVILMVLLFSTQTRCKNDTRRVEDTIKKTFEGYDKRVIPYRKDQPVNCEIRLQLRNLADLKQVSNHITVQLLLKLTWKDHRLTFSKNSTWKKYRMTADSTDLLWTPDIMFGSQKSGEVSSVTRKNIFASVTPDGVINLTERLMMTIFCNMDHTLFPFDVQTCNITMFSYAYSKKWLRLNWHTTPLVIHDEVNAGKFYLADHTRGKFNIDFLVFGFYDGLMVTLKLRRKFMPYMLRIYIPLSIIVVVSWVGFWINYKSVPARTVVGACLVLTMTMFIAYAHASLEHFGGFTAVDLHSIVCLIFVFSTLVEYAMAQTIDFKVKDIEIRHLVIQEKEEEDENQTSENLNFSDQVQVRTESTQRKAKRETSKDSTARCFCCNPANGIFNKLVELHMKHQDEFHILDKISKRVFPLSFLIYNAGYFAIILVSR